MTISSSKKIMIIRQYEIWKKERIYKRNSSLKDLEAKRKQDIAQLQGDHSLRIQAQYDQCRVDLNDLDIRKADELAGGWAWTPPWL